MDEQQKKNTPRVRHGSLEYSKKAKEEVEELNEITEENTDEEINEKVGTENVEETKIEETQREEKVENDETENNEVVEKENEEIKGQEEKNEETKVEDKEERNINIQATTKKEIEKNKNKENNKGKSKDKGQGIVRRIILILLIILVIVGTVVLVLKKINDLKVKYKIDEPVATVFERDEKVEDPDKIYVAHEGETFDLNDIVITEYYYSSDGTISFNYPNGNFASFIQISGLINKEIENNINAKLKEIPINFFNEHPGCNVTTYATASYSNVLSLYSSFYDRTTNEFGYVKGYTIDLNTGNDITLEDVFTKSAPIYSILYNAFLKGRVWVDYEAIERPYYDAQDTDLSNSEDFVYTLKSTYDNHKDDIDFYVDEGKITILNIDENGNYVSDCTKSIDNIDVNIYDVKEYFTLYKKYLGNNLYDNDNYIDQIDVFAESSVFGPLYDYGKKDEVIRMNNENLVVNVGFAFGLNNLDVDIKNSTKNHINNVLNDLINNLVKDDGYVYFFVGSVSGPTHWNAGMNGIYINNTYTSRYTREFYDSRLELTIYKIEKDFWNNNKYKYNALIAQAPKMAMTPYPVSLRLNQNDELFNHFEYINLIEGRNGTYNFDKYYYYDANKNYIGDDGSVVLVEPQYGYGQS